VEVKRILSGAAAAIAAIGIYALAGGGVANAAIAIPTKTCGTQTMQVHVSDNSYYDLNNADESENTTCIVGHPGVATLTVNSVDQHSDWGFPNISSGWEWGQSSCQGAGGACFKYPVEEEHDGNPVSGLAVFPHGGLKGDGAWDIWFNKTNAHPGQDNGTEVMIWISHPGISEPSRMLHAVTIDGIHWDYMTWTASGHGQSWHYIAYIKVNQTTHVSGLSLNSFFHDAINRHLLSPDWYLTAIDGGSEITHGGAGTVVSMSLKDVS
jgi:hypothetical protein